MKLLGLQAKNFMSFRDLDFVFPESGLYFICGEIADGKMSSSNGAGKSAFVESICWSLYGETVRNLDKDGIVNWAVGKNCSAEMIFEDDEGTPYYIRRYRSDSEFQNSLFFYKDGTEVTGTGIRGTQEIINEVLGMNWLVFSSAVIFGEKAQRFTAARDSEKKAVFNELIPLFTQCKEAQKAVREELKGLKNERFVSDGAIAIAKEGFQVAIAEKERISEQMKELDKEKDQLVEAMKDLEVSLIQSKSQKEHAEKKYAKAETIFTEKQKEKSECVVLLDACEAERKGDLDEIYQLVITAQSEMNHEALKIRDLEEKLESLLSDADKLAELECCPTCYKPITDEDIEGVAKHLTAECTALRAPYEKKKQHHLARVKNHEEKKAVWDKKMDEYYAFQTELEEGLVEIAGDKAAAQKVIYEMTSDMKSTELEIHQKQSSFENQMKPLEKALQNLSDKCNQYEKAISHNRDVLKKITEDEIYLNFWVEGFGDKGMKSLLLDEIVPYLNSKVSYYASMLLDDEIRVEFDTESTLKSGETRDKFDVKILRGTEETSYLNCSSGEKRRVDVSVLLALQNLIFERSVGSCNFIVFDELFDSLDVVGIERAVGLLSEEAREKAIMVISHSSELKDYFDNVVLIKKDKSGTSIMEDM